MHVHLTVGQFCHGLIAVLWGFHILLLDPAGEFRPLQTPGLSSLVNSCRDSPLNVIACLYLGSVMENVCTIFKLFVTCCSGVQYRQTDGLTDKWTDGQRVCNAFDRPGFYYDDDIILTQYIRRATNVCVTVTVL